MENNIKKLRTEKGYSQKRLAEEIGLSSPLMIAKYETGQIPIPASRVISLANALGVQSTDLFPEAGSPLIVETISGDVIREQRRRLGITLAKFAEQLGVDYSTASKYENGRMPIPQDRIKDISTILDLPSNMTSEAFEAVALKVLMSAWKNESVDFGLSPSRDIGDFKVEYENKRIFYDIKISFNERLLAKEIARSIERFKQRADYDPTRDSLCFVIPDSSLRRTLEDYIVFHPLRKEDHVSVLVINVETMTISFQYQPISLRGN